MAFRFVFYDHTTDKTPDKMKPASAFTMLTNAMTNATHLFSDYARANLSTFRIAKDVDDRIGGREIGVHFRDTIPEVPDALAYHQTVGGVPDIEIGVDLFSNLVDNGDSLSSGLSHEIFELINDPGANGWKDRQDGSGLCDAEESCDVVQNTGFRLGECYLSNFLLPTFFIPQAEGPWDYLSKMNSQYDISHGYNIQATSPKHISQVTGDAKSFRMNENHLWVMVKGELTEKQIKRKKLHSSRTYRRGIRL